MLPSMTGKISASATFNISGLPSRTLHNPCLRFGPRVTTTPARLGSDLSATTFVARDLHPHVSASLPGALTIEVENRDAVLVDLERQSAARPRVSRTLLP